MTMSEPTSPSLLPIPDLLSCPCCGSADVARNYHNDGRPTWVAGCNGCGLEIARTWRPVTDDPARNQHISDLLQFAVTIAWNKRAAWAMRPWSDPPPNDERILVVDAFEKRYRLLIYTAGFPTHPDYAGWLPLPPFPIGLRPAAHKDPTDAD